MQKFLLSAVYAALIASAARADATIPRQISPEAKTSPASPIRRIPYRVMLTVPMVRSLNALQWWSSVKV
jgi:hypothetical protein